MEIARWILGASALASAVLMAPAASGSVVFVHIGLYMDYAICYPTVNDCPIPNSEDLYHYDLNADSTNDFTVRLVYDGAGRVDYSLAPTTGGDVGGPVPWGTSISGNLDGEDVFLGSRFSPNIIGTPTGPIACTTGCTHYFAIKFKIGTATHYGWVQLMGMESGMMVVDAAYESDANTAIAAGDYGGGLCGTADFNGDEDYGTDQDIEAFFACLGGNCCRTCWPGGADFNGDGDTGTDADIAAFFRVLGGASC